MERCDVVASARKEQDLSDKVNQALLSIGKRTIPTAHFQDVGEGIVLRETE